MDKRNKLFKAVKDNGCAVEFATQDETTLKKMGAGKNKEGKQGDFLCQPGFFLQKTGSDMENISRGNGEAFLLYPERKIRLRKRI